MRVRDRSGAALPPAWTPLSPGSRPMKSAEERIENLEKTVKTYRILVMLLAVLILVLERYRIVGWLDSMESWFSNVFGG